MDHISKYNYACYKLIRLTEIYINVFYYYVSIKQYYVCFIIKYNSTHLYKFETIFFYIYILVKRFDIFFNFYFISITLLTFNKDNNLILLNNLLNLLTCQQLLFSTLLYKFFYFNVLITIIGILSF